MLTASGEFFPGDSCTPDGVAAVIITKAEARPESSTLQAWASIDRASFSTAELAALGRGTAARLGVAVPRATVAAGQQPAVILQGSPDPGKELVLTLRSPQPEGAPGRHPAYLSVEITSSGRQLQAATMAVGRLFGDLGAQPEMRWQYVAVFPGWLSPDEARELATSLGTSVGARPVENMAAGGVISFTGFTPRLAPVVTVASRAVNLNIALRYHAYDRRTYLHIGIPLLDGAY